MVGAYGDADNGSNTGSAYVFTKPGTGWADMTETEKVVAPQYYGSIDSYYGAATAIDGNYAVIGAYGYEGNKGRAFVLFYNGTNWVTQGELTASDGEADDDFGYSVSISGDNIVAGAYGDGYNGDESGSAYVFTKPGTGWTDTTQTAKLTASDGAAYDYFGGSVSISSDNIVIGAYGDNDNGTNESGSAYVFAKPSAGWSTMTQTTKLTASDGASAEYFGWSVSISDNNIVTGAYGDADNGYNSGSAYLFRECVPTVGAHNETVCFGGSIVVNGTTYNVNNLTGTEVFTNAYNCDSTIVVTLTIENQIDVTTTTLDWAITANATVATYRWLDCDNGNAVITGETAQTFTATANGNYAVEVTQNNCIDTSACVSITNVGINETNLFNNVSVYPNPVTDQLTIELNQVIGESYDIRIQNSLGQTIGKFKISNQTTTLDLSTYSPGVYFIRVATQNHSKTVKIIKE